MSIVVLASSTEPVDTIVSLLAAQLSSQPITVIMPASTDDAALRFEHAGLSVLSLEALPDSRFERAMSRSVFGRTFVRITPADRGARLARLVRRSPQAREALAGAEVMVAADRDAILTVWNAARHSTRNPTAVVGVPALSAIVRRRVADDSVAS